MIVLYVEMGERETENASCGEECMWAISANKQKATNISGIFDFRRAPYAPGRRECIVEMCPRT